jgi:hypothetical protein
MTEPQINTKDVVLRLDQKVDGLIKDMADIKVIAATVGVTVETLHDHEMRIRALEATNAENSGEKSYRRYLWPLVAALGWVPDLLNKFHHS